MSPSGELQLRVFRAPFPLLTGRRGTELCICLDGVANIVVERLTEHLLRIEGTAVFVHQYTLDVTYVQIEWVKRPVKNLSGNGDFGSELDRLLDLAGVGKHSRHVEPKFLHSA